MTDAERAADVAKYDAGVSFDQTVPLSPAERSRWERARAGRSATPVSDGSARVLLSLDPKLLVKAQARAKREGKTLSALVSELLRAAERKAS